MGQVSIKWNSTIILCGDMNIDKIKVNNPAYRLYRDVLKGHGLTQHVTQPTRNNQAILDHISTNIPSRVNHTGVLQCPETSDHDYPYISFNVKSQPFEPRFKIKRLMKYFDQQHYKETFAILPFTASFALNNPEDQLGILNDFTIKHLEKHAPMKRIQVTRQPASWMRDIDIVPLRNDCRHIRYQHHQTNKDVDWQSFRKSRNELKSKIKFTKKSFYRKALSSKRPKKIWTTIHQILNPGKKRILFDPETLSTYYTTMAENLTGAKHKTKSEITQ